MPSLRRWRSLLSPSEPAVRVRGCGNERVSLLSDSLLLSLRPTLSVRARPSPARLRAACAPRACRGVRVVVLIVERAPSSARSLFRSYARARLPLRAATL